MQLTYLVTLFIILIVFGVGFLAYQGWRDWGQRRHDPTEQSWRKALTFAALILISLAALMFVGYAVHNAIIGGDQNRSAMTVPYIKTGTTLSFIGVLISVCGKGRGRWAALVGGCFTLLLWFWQGMSL